MGTKSNAGKKYSGSDLEKIRKRASEIWKRKRQSLNTALDDWLQAEREFRAQVGNQNKKPGQYTQEEVEKMKVRAQAIREEKIQSLHTAFNDWIEAEQELKEELEQKVDIHDFFDQWFERSSSLIAELLEKDSTIQPSKFNDILEQQYVELMTQCMT